MKIIERIIEGVILFCLGGMAASVAWSAYTPDQAKQPCVPNYSQTGLECCPIDPE